MAFSRIDAAITLNGSVYLLSGDRSARYDEALLVRPSDRRRTLPV